MKQITPDDVFDFTELADKILNIIKESMVDNPSPIDSTMPAISLVVLATCRAYNISLETFYEITKAIKEKSRELK